MHPSAAPPTSRPALSDARSPRSSDSARVPPKFDPVRVRQGPALLPRDAFDPLRPTTETYDVFWHAVDTHFQPLNVESVKFLRTLAVPPVAGYADRHLTIPALGVRRPKDSPAHPRTESVTRKQNHASKSLASKSAASNSVASKTVSAKTAAPKKPPTPAAANGTHRATPGETKNHGRDAESAGRGSTPSDNAADKAAPPAGGPPFELLDEASLHSCLNAFPFTQRLAAAFLDEAGGGTSAPDPLTGRAARTTVDETLGPALGSASQRRKQQEILEVRVKQELRDVGLLTAPGDDDDELQTRMREAQWKLRDVRATNRLRQRALVKNGVMPELRLQNQKREAKRHDDTVERAYLECMISRLKKNKKSRSKFQKILTRSFAHYKEAERKQMVPAGVSVDAPVEVRPAKKAGASRKKKRKLEGGGVQSAKKAAKAKKSGHGDAGRDS